MPLLFCARHLVYDDACDRCRHVQIMNALAGLDAKIQVALDHVMSIERKHTKADTKSE